ncbi:MAG: CocE/NonD family hydrolase, partial [Pseudomonadota bacterium]
EDNVVPFFFEFLKHPVPDEWTDSILFSDRHAEVTAPSLTIAGWHDLLLGSDLEHFQGMRANGGSAQARENSRLIVGPWAHGMFLHVVGDVDFGFRSNGMFLDLKEDLTKLQLAWFDPWLTDEPLDNESAPVKLFVQGTNRWRDEDDWPPKGMQARQLFLTAEGGLAHEKQEEGHGSTSYVYDPNDPCPTCGGNLLLPPQYVPGPVDQAPILNRRDVLVFRSPPIEQGIDVIGPVKAVLYAASSARDTDFMVKLCDIHPDGKTINVCDGVVRASFRNGESLEHLNPNETVRYEIDLWSTAQHFSVGHRIGVLVTSSDFPRYDRNPNTGELAHEARSFEPALQRIYHDQAHASYIELPVCPG